jgi:GntR family transcriptional regulator
MTAISGKNKKTIAQQIALDIIQDIQASKWKLGESLPSEMELTKRFKVSRTTLREALRRLQESGYIHRTQGARSVLASQQPEKMFVNIASTADDILLYVKDTRSTLLASEYILVDDVLASVLNCEKGSQRLRITFLRWRKDAVEPFCYTEVFVAPLFEGIQTRLEGASTVYNLIEKYYAVAYTRIEQGIEAQRADPNLASRLSVLVDSPLLRVTTTFYGASDLLAEVSISYFPERRYKLQIVRQRHEQATTTLSEPL